MQLLFLKEKGRYWQNNQQRQVVGCAINSGLDAFPGLERELGGSRALLLLGWKLSLNHLSHLPQF